MGIREILADGKFWSGILCFASVSRGTAYIERPPSQDSVAVRAIETYISYPAWGVLLLVTAMMIATAHLLPPLRWMGIVGHSFSIAIYGTFGISLGVSALVAKESWANTGLFIIAALLHAACAIYMGNDIAERKIGVKD